MLQWGRNFIVAETYVKPRRLDRRLKDASMGPQLYRCGNEMPRRLTQLEAASWGRNYRESGGVQWGRNFIVAETRTCAMSVWEMCRFNGAATLSLRKPGARQGDVSSQPTDMELQWGRNFIVAETSSCSRHAGAARPCTRFRVRFNGAATLSLRKPSKFCTSHIYRCGNSIAYYASMGPQLYRCGNCRPTPNHAPRRVCFNGAATLSLRKLSFT